ncbi:hypothetical protein [Nocardioides piscis]|uniref:Type VII secretion integral membrane protein EccD n=1 Tax=Nocardioides piscis TaxID=2714938 RepID=A0A6G7YCP2_9ACTN|nr:hypothetical protein [Nocardioides piscis]QIK74674.1 hypothetical protein G7071_03790 [Nocardioides piscis]
MRASSGLADTLSLSVHGPGGVLDLVVPRGATPLDVARAYADQAGLPALPLLQTLVGQHLRADQALRDVGIESGDVLVATTGVRRARAAGAADATTARVDDSPGVAALLLGLASLAACLSGWYAALSATDWMRALVVGLLLGCAVACAIPKGRHAAQRVATAPVFAAAAAFAAAFAPDVHLTAAVVAVSGLAAAVTAAVSRIWSVQRDQVLTVWIVAGVLVFVLGAVSPLLGWDDRVSWGLLLLVATFGARLVPQLAVEVPDDALLDLDRLAVSAWSARDPSPGGRSRIVTPEAAMHRLVDDSSRTVTAACAAILLTAVISTPLLLASATIDLDRIGASCLAFLSGSVILLVARQYRHPAARRMLRGAGLACWAWLVAFGIGALPSTWLLAGLVGVLGLGLVAVAVAVASGRGWRSVWWARKADLAEGLAGAFALASTVVASGLFRALWETTS